MLIADTDGFFIIDDLKSAGWRFCYFGKDIN